MSFIWGWIKFFLSIPLAMFALILIIAFIVAIKNEVDKR